MPFEGSPPQDQQAAIQAFEALSMGGVRLFGSVEYSQSAPGAPSTVEASGSRDFYHPEWEMTAQTINGIGSNTKQFTAATLMKQWDNELSANKGKKEEEVEYP